MKINQLFAICSVVILGLPMIGFAQYTETINTNNPGQSQGAFSVGTGVYQIEASAFYRKEDHSLLLYERDVTGLALQGRVGVWKEQLEIVGFATFASVDQTVNQGFGSVESSFSNFSRATVGAKYLVFDPIKKWGERKINLYSYKDNRRIKWRDLVPAVSVFAGANLDLDAQNPLIPQSGSKISPRLELITQHNFGPWVFVMNFVGDRVTTDLPSYEGIFTMTHSLNNRWAIFGEFQTFISDFYSDDLARGGVAYLINRQWQLDASAAVNFKDTPSLYQVNLGMSYRLDFHKDPEVQQ